jgi:predicted dehydrogenase
MNRRDFTRLSALALAATRVPAIAQGTPTGKPVGYAAIGLGTISNLFMQGCAKSQNSKITALVTGHPDTKGKKYAAMYGIPESSIYTYETFDRIRDNKAVDAVYVGLPNSMHREYTVRGAQAGKHVLCEKPMAISSAECQEMVDACKTAKVKLMIAYRCHYDPTYLELGRVLQSGALGQIQAFESANGFNARPNQWRLTKQYAGGGSLMDMGIYSVNAVRLYTGEEPIGYTAITATRDNTSGRFTEVEESMDFTLKFPSGIVAAVGTTYGADMNGYLRIHGEKGSLELSPAFGYTGIHLKSLSKNIQADATSSDDPTVHFTLEGDHFSNAIRTDTTPNTPGEEGLKDMLAIEAIYKAAGAPIA